MSKIIPIHIAKIIFLFSFPLFFPHIAIYLWDIRANNKWIEEDI
jgi:hypothetical protein